jgi:hypothetical protein
MTDLFYIFWICHLSCIFLVWGRFPQIHDLFFAQVYNFLSYLVNCYPLVIFLLHWQKKWNKNQIFEGLALT